MSTNPPDVLSVTILDQDGNHVADATMRPIPGVPCPVDGLEVVATPEQAAHLRAVVMQDPPSFAERREHLVAFLQGYYSGPGK